MNERMQGRVLRLVKDRGFGFVIGDSDGLSRFFEAREVNPRIDFDTMKEGMRVSFLPIAAATPNKGNGLRARQVQVL